MKNPPTTQYTCAGCVLAVVFLVAFYLGFAYFDMLAWNLVAMNFHWPSVSYLVMLAILFLLAALGSVLRIVATK